MRLYIIILMSLLLCVSSVYGVIDGHGLTLNSQDTTDIDFGLQIRANGNINVTNLTVHSSVTATRLRILNNLGNLMQTSTNRVGDVFFFSQNMTNQSVLSYTIDAGGVNYDRRRDASVSTYPIYATNIIFENGTQSGLFAISSAAYNVINFGSVSLDFLQWEPPTPESGARNNTQILINASCPSGFNVTAWFDSNSNPVGQVMFNTSNIDNYTTAVGAAGTYYYKASCDSGATNSTIRTWIFDDVLPTINLTAANFFNAQNTSKLSRTTPNTKWSVNLSDNSLLFGLSLNVTNSSDRSQIFFYYQNESLTGTQYLFEQAIDFSNWTIGNYSFVGTVSDSHTALTIKDYAVEKSSDYLRYDGNIKVSADGAINAQTTKHKDRYDFEFSYSKGSSSTKVYYVESRNKLVYLPHSAYPAHFVDPVEKKWIDFEGATGTPTVTKVSDYKYRIIFTDSRDKITFNSIGGLNIISLEASFEILSLFPTDLLIFANNLTLFNHSAEYNKHENISLNITIFNDIVENGCSCTNCSLNDNMCRVPISFSSSTASDLEVSIYNLTSSFGVDNCTSSFYIPTNSTSLNVSLFDENDALFSMPYASTVNFYYGANTTYLDSFSHSATTNNMKYCQYPYYANFIVDQQFEYTYDGTLFSYFLDDFNYTNITQNVYLYGKNDTTQVLFTVNDLDTNPVAEAYIHVLKYDVGTGIYTLSEILRTDTNGQAIGNIVLNTVFYNFLIYYEGRLVYSELGTRVVTTTRTFTVNLGVANWLTNYATTLGVNTQLYFNDTTQNFVFIWSDPTGEMHQGCLRVDKHNQTDKYLLTDTCTTATSGTIVYNIPTLDNGTDYIGTAYLKYDDEQIVDRVTKSIGRIRDFFNQKPNLSLFIAFFWCLALFLIGMPNPNVAYALFAVGIITSASLGLYKISSLHLGSLIILFIIQLYLGGRGDK